MSWLKGRKTALAFPWQKAVARFSRPQTGSNQSSASSAALADVSSRLDLVRQHGDFSLAYATAVQPFLRHFGDEHGYIAYNVHRATGYKFVLGDPVTAAENREPLLTRFIAEHPHAAFCQISTPTALILHKCGLRVNDMGIDTILPLPEYNFQGQDKRWIRQATSWTSSRGFTIREDSTGAVSEDEINAVSQAWRATRVAKREVVFLNRRLIPSPEANTRRFFFYDPDARLLAFVFFDPLYRDGQLIGYVACNKCRHPEAPPHAEQSLMKHAIEQFQREGLQEVRLGLSPFANIEDRQLRPSWVINKMFRGIYSSRIINRVYYNVQGHANYKRKFRGREEKLYFATPGWENVFRLLALLKLCKVV